MEAETCKQDSIWRGPWAWRASRPACSWSSPSSSC